MVPHNCHCHAAHNIVPAWPFGTFRTLACCEPILSGLMLKNFRATIAPWPNYQQKR